MKTRIRNRKLTKPHDVDYLSLNLGLPECQYALDADMIEILLERPEPPAPAPERRVREPEGDPVKFLGPVQMDWAATLLRGEDAAFENLAARQPPFYRVRGVWRMADDLAGGFSSSTRSLGEHLGQN
jgi:hypothetical protein